VVTCMFFGAFFVLFWSLQFYMLHGHLIITVSSFDGEWDIVSANVRVSIIKIIFEKSLSRA
jgi:hypothetical protein